MSQFVSAVALEALSRARAADGHSARYRRQRDQAVAEAIAAGISMEMIADELGVLISDVEKMARSGRRQVGMAVSTRP